MVETKRPVSIASGVLAMLALLMGLVVGAPAASAQGVDPAQPFLALSRSADRSDPVPLDGATVAPGELLAIFLAPIDTEANNVQFYINNERVRTDFAAPWDLGGTNRTGRAQRIPAEQLQEGENVVVARVAKGNLVIIVSATVTLASSPPPVTAVSGVVSLAGGAGVGDVVVDLFAAAADGSRAGYLRSASSGPDGAYRFEVEPGCQVLVFIAPGVTSASPLVWQATGGLFQEVVVCVEAGQTATGVNTVLVDPTSDQTGITGAVSLGGAGVSGVVVDLFDGAADGTRGGYLRSATTGDDGAYTIPANAGCYVLVFIAPEVAVWAATQNQFLEVGGCVPEGGSLTGVDAVLADATTPAPASIGGVIGFDDGTPVSGVAVDLFEAAADGARSAYLRSTTSGDEGAYGFGVEAGCYVLVFIAPAGEVWVGSGSGFLEAPGCVADGDDAQIPAALVTGDGALPA